MSAFLLVVEDEENDAFFLKRALEKAGLANRAHFVEDGQFAVDYLSGSGKFADRESYPLPGVVFLDLKLPRMHGLEVLKWLRAQAELPPMIVVVLTSSAVDSDMEKAYRLGANSYVVKPSQPQDLLRMVEAFRGWWMDYNQLPHGSNRA
jgi:CheY-like chemotaxis protein